MRVDEECCLKFLHQQFLHGETVSMLRRECIHRKDLSHRVKGGGKGGREDGGNESPILSNDSAVLCAHFASVSMFLAVLLQSSVAESPADMLIDPVSMGIILRLRLGEASASSFLFRLMSTDSSPPPPSALSSPYTESSCHLSPAFFIRAQPSPSP